MQINITMGTTMARSAIIRLSFLLFAIGDYLYLKLTINYVRKIIL